MKNLNEYVNESSRKVQGIAPGQFAVIYDRDSRICYGSGIITGRNIENEIII
jgi:tRNA-specific 2-thiouridylase